MKAWMSIKAHTPEFAEDAKALHRRLGVGSIFVHCEGETTASGRVDEQDREWVER